LKKWTDTNTKFSFGVDSVSNFIKAHSVVAVMKHGQTKPQIMCHVYVLNARKE